MQEFNKKLVAEFRQNDGIVGGPFEGISLLLLSTIGAKSGLTRVTPLAYIADGDDYIVAASNAGAKSDPPWLGNLSANPAVDVEVGRDHFAATASVIAEPRRSELYARLTEAMPAFADYQAKISRTIPVVALVRT